MKKLSTILALALVVALSASFAVSAAEVEHSAITELGSVSKDVKFTVEETIIDDVVYSVDVAWTDLSFTYNEGELSWNPEDHDYTKADADAQWTDDKGSVTVTNHSNADVAVTVSFSDDNADDELSVEVANGSFTLESAVGKQGQDGDSDVAALTAKGTPTASGKIGSIVVAIAAAN